MIISDPVFYTGLGIVLGWCSLMLVLLVVHAYADRDDPPRLPMPRA